MHHGSVVIAVGRKANHAADWIAKADRSTILPSNWVHNQPDSLNNFLVSASKVLKEYGVLWNQHTGCLEKMNIISKKITKFR